MKERKARQSRRHSKPRRIVSLTKCSTFLEAKAGRIPPRSLYSIGPCLQVMQAGCGISEAQASEILNAKNEHYRNFKVGDTESVTTAEGTWFYWIDSILDNGELDLVGSFVPARV